ncbi:MAG: inositol monophosphatase family protein [Candidatus Bathyarchaeia archaeon]
MSLLNLIEEALMAARSEVIKGLRTPTARNMMGIGAGGDVSRAIDLVAEGAVLDVIRRYFHNATLLSEESGEMKIGKGGFPLFVLDPIDGSTNAIRGYPCFSSSLAIANGYEFSRVQAAGVINIPSGDLFTAEVGRGAFLNGKRIRPSEVKRISEALLAIDLNVRRGGSEYLEKIRQVLLKARHIRFLGTDALEIALVSSGTCDAFVDLRRFLRVTDVAAAAFIVQEGKGIVVDGEGNPLDLKMDLKTRVSLIASGTKELCDEILSNLVKA